MRSDGTIKKASLSRRACWETQIMHNTTGKANSYFYYRWQCRIVMAVAGGDKLTRTGQKRQSSLSGFICTQVQLNSSSKTGVWRTGSLSSRSALSSLLHSSGSTFLLPVATFNTLARGHLQPTASLTSDFKFTPKNVPRASASVFIWHNGLEYIIREVGRERARRGSFSSVLTTNRVVLGVSPRRQRAAALLWLSSAAGFLMHGASLLHQIPDWNDLTCLFGGGHAMCAQARSRRPVEMKDESESSDGQIWFCSVWEHLK